MIKCPDLFNSYTNAIFFAAQVVTTIGYGNQYPRSDNGMIFIIFYALIFVPIGTFSSNSHWDFELSMELDEKLGVVLSVVLRVLFDEVLCMVFGVGLGRYSHFKY